jgi:hypothetical protein
MIPDHVLRAVARHPWRFLAEAAAYLAVMLALLLAYAIF